MKPSSQRKILASRANGALSRGPVTEAGKRRSAANSLSHGLCSSAVLLPTESRRVFDHHLKTYVKNLQPADAAQLDLVHQLAVNKWQQRRLWRLEQQMMETAIPVPPPAWLGEPHHLSDFDPESHYVTAYAALMEHRPFQILQGHIDRLFNRYLRISRRLAELQHPFLARKKRQNEISKADPN